MTDAPTSGRRQLGRTLRKARKDAGLTQSAVAQALGCSQGKVNKIETWLVAIKPDELERLIELYRLPPEKADEIRELVAQDRLDRPRRAAFRPAWSAFAELSELESEATEILCWHSERIPGPLQSEPYMLGQHDPETLTTPRVVKLLRQRKARAQLFTLDSPPRYRAILSESSLHRMPGGRIPGLIVDQVEHLLALMNRFERLELQILTFDARIRFVNSDFEILRFPGDRADYAYVEHPGGSRSFSKDVDLREFHAHWQQLHAAALDQDRTRQFLRQLAKNARGQDPPYD